MGFTPPITGKHGPGLFNPAPGPNATTPRSNPKAPAPTPPAGSEAVKGTDHLRPTGGGVRRS